MYIPHKYKSGLMTKTKIVCSETIIKSNNHTIIHEYRKHVVLYSVDCIEYATIKKIII